MASVLKSEIEPAAGRARELGDKQDRPGPLLARPAAFLTLVILSWVAVGLAIFWLLRSARI